MVGCSKGQVPLSKLLLPPDIFVFLPSPVTSHLAAVYPLYTVAEQLLNGLQWSELTDGKFSKPMQPVAAESLVQNEGRRGSTLLKG